MKVYGYNGENVLNENPTKYLHVPNAVACEYLKFKDQSFKLTSNSQNLKDESPSVLQNRCTAV